MNYKGRLQRIAQKVIAKLAIVGPRSDPSMAPLIRFDTSLAPGMPRFGFSLSRGRMQELADQGCDIHNKQRLQRIAEKAVAQFGIQPSFVGPQPAPPTPLLVRPGTSLVPGKLYLRLSNGRTDPDQEMEEQGFDGPTFGPLSRYKHIYCLTFRIYADSVAEELWLNVYDDMVEWDCCFYGDMDVFVAGPNETA